MTRYLSESRIREELTQRGYPMNHEHFKRYREWGLIPERVEGKGYPESAIEQIITVRQLGNEGHTLAPRVVLLYDHADFIIPADRVFAAMYEVVRGIETPDEKTRAIHVAARHDEATQKATDSHSSSWLRQIAFVDADPILPMLFPIQDSASLFQAFWVAEVSSGFVKDWYAQARRLETGARAGEYALPEMPFTELVTLLTLRNLHLLLWQMVEGFEDAAKWLWQKAAGLIERVKPVRKQRNITKRNAEPEPAIVTPTDGAFHEDAREVGREKDGAETRMTSVHA